jgi:hypothetical protein
MTMQSVMHEIVSHNPTDVLELAGPEGGARVLIATMHGKEAVLAPALAALGFKVVLPLGFDTDALGTFSGDKRRFGTAFEAALEKARRACDITGALRAVASEGTYRPCKSQFPGARNAELLAFVDRERGFECIEFMTDLPTRFAAGRVPARPSSPEVHALLAAIGWPAVRVIVVPRDPAEGISAEEVFKGIGDHAALSRAVEACAAHSPDGKVHIETDLRAHMNPTRMASLTHVAARLASRLRREGYGTEVGRMLMATA